MKLSDFICGEFGNLICFAYCSFIENEPESEKDDNVADELLNIIYEIKTGETYVDDYFSQKLLEMYYKSFMFGVIAYMNSGKSIQSVVDDTFNVIKREANDDEWMFCKNTYDRYIKKLYSNYGKQALIVLFTRRVD